jgi:hypothetical protein
MSFRRRPPTSFKAELACYRADLAKVREEPGCGEVHPEDEQL